MKKPVKGGKNEAFRKATIERIKTGVPGFDELVSGGIEKNSIILVSGGTGTGKTNFCSRFLYHGVLDGEKGLYITFEEEPRQIKSHMELFKMDFEKMEKEGKIRFLKMDVNEISRRVHGALLKARGELMIKELPSIVPRDFKPDRIVIDSLSALASVFKEEDYRYFVFKFFSLLKETGATTFAISETRTEPTEYSRTGIEEFLGDGVIVLYNIKSGDTRIRALEILKLRGTKHEEKIVPFKITNEGVIVYPGQSLLTALRD